MKYSVRHSLLFTLFAFVSLLILPKSAVFSDSPATLHIASYNIQICRGDGTKSYKPEEEQSTDRTSAAILRLNPDVIGLQEVDRRTDRSRHIDQIAELAEKTERHFVYAESIPLPGGQYGIGILAKTEPIRTERIPLPGQEEARVLLIAEFDDFVFFDTHFSLTPESRKESAQIVNEAMLRQTKPVILVGDMNVDSDDERAELFGRYWTVLSADLPTFPAHQPRARIDYIQIADPAGAIPVNDPRWFDAVVQAGVADEPETSDHRPVFVEIKRDIFAR